VHLPRVIRDGSQFARREEHAGTEHVADDDCRDSA
jgi:hypothetical protein